MRVAVYVRVSNQPQTQSQTIEQQLERLRAHIQSPGWQLSDEDVFRDAGFRGAALPRAALDRLRDRAAVGTRDRVLLTAPIASRVKMSIRACTSKNCTRITVRSRFAIAR